MSLLRRNFVSGQGRKALAVSRKQQGHEFDVRVGIREIACSAQCRENMRLGILSKHVCHMASLR